MTRIIPLEWTPKTHNVTAIYSPTYALYHVYVTGDSGKVWPASAWFRVSMFGMSSYTGKDLIRSDAQKMGREVAFAS